MGKCKKNKKKNFSLGWAFISYLMLMFSIDKLSLLTPPYISIYVQMSALISVLIIPTSVPISDDRLIPVYTIKLSAS